MKILLITKADWNLHLCNSFTENTCDFKTDCYEAILKRISESNLSEMGFIIECFFIIIIIILDCSKLNLLFSW